MKSFVATWWIVRAGFWLFIMGMAVGILLGARV